MHDLGTRSWVGGSLHYPRKATRWGSASSGLSPSEKRRHRPSHNAMSPWFRRHQCPWLRTCAPGAPPGAPLGFLHKWDVFSSCNNSLDPSVGIRVFMISYTSILILIILLFSMTAPTRPWVRPRERPRVRPSVPLTFLYQNEFCFDF